MNILLFNNTSPGVQQNLFSPSSSVAQQVGTTCSLSPSMLITSSSSLSTDVNSMSSATTCRLIKSETSNLNSSNSTRRTSLENYKLKPIEQIQQQIAWNQFTVNNYEKYFMLKIKCKCIHILNRLISLVYLRDSYSLF